MHFHIIPAGTGKTDHHVLDLFPGKMTLIVRNTCVRKESVNFLQDRIGGFCRNRRSRGSFVRCGCGTGVGVSVGNGVNVGSGVLLGATVGVVDGCASGRALHPALSSNTTSDAKRNRFISMTSWL